MVLKTIKKRTLPQCEIDINPSYGYILAKGAWRDFKVTVVGKIIKSDGTLEALDGENIKKLPLGSLAIKVKDFVEWDDKSIDKILLVNWEGNPSKNGLTATAIKEMLKGKQIKVTTKISAQKYLAGVWF
jgi:hypothetical protein